MGTDEIIDAVGGMGRFQIMAMFILLGPRFLSGWSMLMMSFGNAAPESWWCESETQGVPSNNSIKVCPAEGNSSCTFMYSGEKHTVVDEWDLVCDKTSIGPLIIAIQMGGVLAGCLLSGQSSDMIGRKKTYIVSIVLEGGFNLVAAFSTSWEMFAALRFCIGGMIGTVLTISFPYYMEFVGQEWRPITAVAPFWQAGTCALALSAYLRPHWSHLHIILGALHVPFLIGFFFVPESLRWLAIHGHLKEAETVVDKMAKLNKTKKPGNTATVLKNIYEEEQKNIEAGHKYTYLDIYRTMSFLWKSLVLQFVWMCMSFVFYGIAFGVGKLHGSLYLNIFLLSVVGLPGVAMVYVFNNKIGRRWTAFLFFAVATSAAFAVAVVSKFMSLEAGRGIVTTVLALICRFGVASAWNGYAVLTTESYPTTVRNLGYGAANTAARVGSIVSPYIFSMGGGELLIPFIIVGSLMGLCALSCLTLKETKGCPLQDTTLVTEEPKVEQHSNGNLKDKRDLGTDVEAITKTKL